MGDTIRVGYRKIDYWKETENLIDNRLRAIKAWIDQEETHHIPDLKEKLLKKLREYEKAASLSWRTEHVADKIERLIPLISEADFSQPEIFQTLYKEIGRPMPS